MRLRFPSWIPQSTILATLILPLWITGADAMPISVNFSASPTTSLAAGDSLTVTAYLTDAVAFNTLDAVLSWDSQYLVPVDQVSAMPFFVLGGVFTGTGFNLISFGPTPGDSLIAISLASLLDFTERASGSGELFNLSFQVRNGVALPASTLIQFNSLGASGEALDGVGLVLQQIFDQYGNVIDPQPDPYTATPSALTVAFATASLPEPATGLLCLAGLLAMRRFDGRRTRH